MILHRFVSLYNSFAFNTNPINSAYSNMRCCQIQFRFGFEVLEFIHQ